MDAFFASVEQASNPALRGKPVLVGGAPGTRTVVAAASYEARPYGIKSGKPLMEALRLCPEAILVQGNISKYIDASRRVFQICKDYTDLLEVYSIDECFLDVTDTKDHFGSALEIGSAIKHRVKKNLGLTCSIGIAPNKLLAKLACGMQKPNGLIEINQEQAMDLLQNLPVQKLHGIGAKTQARLMRMGITKAGELGRTPREVLRRQFGVLGDVLHGMGNGEYHSPIVPYHDEPEVKSVGHSHTLERNTRNWDFICSNLLRLSEMVGRRLREQGFAGRTVHLVLRYADMNTFGKQKSLPEHLDDGYSIYKVAVSILENQWDRDRRPIRLVGVCVSDLTKGIRQMNLFANPKSRDLLSTMDTINNRYGEFAIKRASLLDLKTKPKTHGFENISQGR